MVGPVPSSRDARARDAQALSRGGGHGGLVLAADLFATFVAPVFDGLVPVREGPRPVTTEAIVSEID